MQEETSGGTTTINQYPNNNGWNGGPGWGWGAPYAAVPAYPAYGYGYGNGGFGGLDGLMRGFGGNINLGGGRGMSGTALGLAIGALALPTIGALFGGRGFGPGGPGCDFVTQKELSLVRENGALQGENGQLKAQIYTDNKIDGVVKTLVEWRQRQELIDTQTAAEVATLKAENANLKSTLGGMLGTYIQPQTFAPSQAVFSAMTANAAGKAASTTPASGN